MLGGRADNKDIHFAGTAKRFAMDAKMFRCRAAVHVENKDDIVFWSGVLKHFRPNDRFHFIAGSRNEFGHETSGVTQCLKYFDYLSPDFFICIDSDYRYLSHERRINVRYFVIQTYTYSFENHHCFAEGLDAVCSRVTHLENRVFDFRRFLKEYSRIIYDLFVWHLYFLGADPSVFSKFEFNKYLNLNYSKSRLIVGEHTDRALDDLRSRVDRKTGYFGRRYPHADLQTIREKYEALGLTPDTVYLFVRGHNVYDMIVCILKEVCKTMLEREKGNRKNTREMVNNLYKNRNNVEIQLKQNIKYGAYMAIRKVEEDIKRFFGEKV